MIMVPIDLYDLVDIELATEDRFTCNVEGLAMDNSNTVVKAATLMREVYHLDQKFHIHVEKNIPAQAGLAGGSSDGAAVMRGIRELCKLDVPIEELAMLSLSLIHIYAMVMDRGGAIQGNRFDLYIGLQSANPLQRIYVSTANAELIRYGGSNKQGCAL